MFQVIDRGMCRRSPAMAIMPFEPARENVRFGSQADIGKVRLMSALPSKRTLLDGIAKSAVCQKATYINGD